MSTPITDHAWNAPAATHVQRANNVKDTARRLETDRTALMEALEQIANQRANRYESTVGLVCNIAESALTAAKANFPQP